MKVHFYLKNTKSTTPTLIVASISFNSTKYRTSTKLSIEPKYWSKSKQLVKPSYPNYTKYNSLLNDISTKLESKYLEYKSNHNILDSKSFKEYLNNKQKHTYNQFNCIIDVMYRYKQEKSLRMLKSSLKTYNSSIENVKRFEHTINYNGLLDLDKFINDYINYELKNNNKMNTIMKRIRHIKTALSYFNVKGYSNISVDRINTHHVYLNTVEIQSIMGLVIENRHIENSRRLFLIQLHTGLRVSDLMSLPFGQISDIISINIQKTKQPIQIPIHPNIKNIINLPYPISHQKYNKNIKHICYLANITNNASIIQHNNIVSKPKYKLISSHTARRSFATNNLTLLPEQYIMKLMGISNHSTFIKYIKLNQYDIINHTKSIWNK